MVNWGYDLILRSRPAFVFPRDWTGVGAARWGVDDAAVDAWAEAWDRELLEMERCRRVGSMILVFEDAVTASVAALRK